jgi:hypothetical protein
MLYTKGASAIGVIIGFLVATALYLFIMPFFPHYALGHYLDKDTIYLKTGAILHGRVVKETNDMVVFESGRSLLTIPRSGCMMIQRDTLLRYLRILA